MCVPAGCHHSYGTNCATPCGHCERGQSCDPVTGACPGLCLSGWTGTNCKTSRFMVFWRKSRLSVICTSIHTQCMHAHKYTQIRSHTDTAPFWQDTKHGCECFSDRNRFRYFSFHSPSNLSLLSGWVNFVKKII